MPDTGAPVLPPAPVWKRTPLIPASIVLHALALGAVLWQVHLWPWALAALVLNHVILTAISLWPRSQALGPNLTRLPAAAAQRGEIALTIDDGPDPEVTPAVLDLLDAHGVHATFFCIGARARAHPDLCRAIVQRGHAVENHSDRHCHTFSLLGPRGYARELHAAQVTLSGITGVTPGFFRAPAGLRNPFLGPVLARHKLLLASWTRRGFDTRETRPDVVLQRLLHKLRPGDILLLHDGHAARTAQGRPVILDVLPPLLRAISNAGLTPVTLQTACAAPATSSSPT